MPWGIRYAFRSQVVSRKLSFLPQLHSRWDLRQLLQVGLVSSHLRWRSLHVRQPVRVLLGLSSGVASLALFLEGNGLLVGESLLEGGVAVLAMLTLARGQALRRRSPWQGDHDPVTGRAVGQVCRSLHFDLVVNRRVVTVEDVGLVEDRRNLTARLRRDATQQRKIRKIRRSAAAMAVIEQ